MDKQAIDNNYKQLFKFYLITFDIRRLNGQFMFESIEEIEGHLITAFMSLIMKLNETTFKPIFIKILDWANSQNSEIEKEQFTLSKLSRFVFFFRLVDSLADKLKSIFVPYYGYLLDLCVLFLKEKQVEIEPQDDKEEDNKKLKKKKTTIHKSISRSFYNC